MFPIFILVRKNFLNFQYFWHPKEVFLSTKFLYFYTILFLYGLFLSIQIFHLSKIFIHNFYAFFGTFYKVFIQNYF